MSSDTEDQGGYRQINKSLNICAFQEYLDGQTASLEHLEDIDQLTPKVLRIMGQNPGKVNNPSDASKTAILTVLSLHSKGPTRLLWVLVESVS